MSKESPTMGEVFGEDTKAVFLVKAKNGGGLYSVHQSAPDDILEQKTHFEAKLDISLKDVCKEFDIPYRDDEDV